MKRIPCALLAACCLAVMPALSACTSMQTVEAHGNASVETIRVGDKVRVVTTDGRELIVEVSALDGETLSGSEIPRGKEPRQEAPDASIVEIPRDEIQTLEVERVDGWKTAGFIGGALAVSWLIGALATTAVIIAL